MNNFQISIAEDDSHIRIRVLEVVTGELEKEFAEKAIKEARERNIHKFLVDVRGVRNVASSTDKYRFGYEDLSQFGQDKDSKVAILADPDDRSHNFIETVLLNAGYSCHLFTDEAAAIEWLAG